MILYQCKRSCKDSKKNETCVFFTHKMIFFLFLRPEKKFRKWVTKVIIGMNTGVRR